MVGVMFSKRRRQPLAWSSRAMCPPRLKFLSTPDRHLYEIDPPVLVQLGLRFREPRNGVTAVRLNHTMKQ